MQPGNDARGIITENSSQLDTHLYTWAEAFLLDRKAQNVSPGTITFYRKKLKTFLEFCDSQIVTQITQITPNIIRQYLFYLEDRGHNPGGVHACYRTLKVFLRWYEAEDEPEGWKNPIRKVKAPRVTLEILDPVELDTIRGLLDTCRSKGFTDLRDRAILLCLLDTGARAREFLDINLTDVNLVTGSVWIVKGKGGKPRAVFLGRMARKAVRAYLKRRKDGCPPLWVRAGGERLTYGGLRAIVTRRAKQAGMKAPALHDFRRAFALNMLRNGVDVFSLQRLMEHADLSVLQRYLAQTNGDLEAAHARYGPVENSVLKSSRVHPTRAGKGVR